MVVVIVGLLVVYIAVFFGGASQSMFFLSGSKLS